MGGFHAGFDMHYSAQKAISHSALMALKKGAPSDDKKNDQKAADDKEVKKEAKKAAVEAAKKAAKKEVKKEAQKAAIRAARKSKATAEKKAEMTAIHTVQKAAKAILKQKTEASTMMETKKTKAKTKKLSKKQLRAEKKAIGIVAKAITSMNKKSVSTGQVGEELEAVIENTDDSAEDDFEEDRSCCRCPSTSLPRRTWMPSSSSRAAQWWRITRACPRMSSASRTRLSCTRQKTSPWATTCSCRYCQRTAIEPSAHKSPTSPTGKYRAVTLFHALSARAVTPGR